MHPIGEAARRSGVHVETIRYYERTGLLPGPARSASGRRLYDKDGISRLRCVRRCRGLGFPLSEIKALLALSIEGDGEIHATACADVRAIGERQRRQVRAKIDDLLELEAALGMLIEECREARGSCPALRQLFDD